MSLPTIFSTTARLDRLEQGQQAILVLLTSLTGALQKFMSTPNTLAAQLQAAATAIQTSEAKIETDLTTLAQLQSAAVADFQSWLASQQASTIDPNVISSLSALADKFGSVDATLQQLATAAKNADPGAAPAPAPVNQPTGS